MWLHNGGPIELMSRSRVEREEWVISISHYADDTGENPRIGKRILLNPSGFLFSYATVCTVICHSQVRGHLKNKQLYEETS